MELLRLGQTDQESHLLEVALAGPWKVGKLHSSPLLCSRACLSPRLELLREMNFKHSSSEQSCLPTTELSPAGLMKTDQALTHVDQLAGHHPTRCQSLVRFPAGGCAWVVGLVPIWGRVRGN